MQSFPIGMGLVCGFAEAWFVTIFGFLRLSIDEDCDIVFIPSRVVSESELLSVRFRCIGGVQQEILAAKDGA